MAVGMKKEIMFQLENPSEDAEVDIVVMKCPEKAGFSISIGEERAQSVTIAPGAKVTAVAQWMPMVDMSVREIAYLKMNKKLPLQLTLHGIAGTGEASAPKGGRKRATSASAVAANKKKGLRTRSASSINSASTEETEEEAVAKKRSVSEAMTKAAKRVKGNKEKEAAKATKDKDASAPVSVTAVMHDNNWLDKQMKGFTDWMNFTFAQAEAQVIDEDEEATVVAAGERAGIASPGPSLRGVMERQRNARTRKTAMEFFHSAETQSIIESVHGEIVAGRLAFRDDKNVHADIGLRALMQELMLSYEAQWLRLALETVFGEVLSLPPVTGRSKSLTDEQRWRAALKSFVVDRILSDPVISEAQQKPLLSLAQQEKLEQDLRCHSLLKFLCVVFVADKFRTLALIKCPTLFVREAQYKSSRDILLLLNREFLRGQGDIVRHLDMMKFTVAFKQTYIDEHRYHISNIKVDLRDGVKLARLVEVLSSTCDISPALRVPANSRLQKLYNVGLVLTRLGEVGTPLEGIEAKHIVDGHRDRTLLLLWKILYAFEYRVLVNEPRLKREIMAHDAAQSACRFPRGGQLFKVSDLERAPLAVSVAARNDDGSIVAPTTRYGRPFDASPLMAWCDAVAGRYGVPVCDMTSALADGRALCLLVHHYHPAVLPLHMINPTTKNIFESCFSEDSSMDRFTEVDHNLVPPEVLERALEAERRNFAVLRRACHEIGGIPLMLPAYDTRNLPEEKTTTIFMGYLFARLVESSSEVNAVTTIQNFCRARLAGLRRIALDKARRAAKADKKKRKLTDLASSSKGDSSGIEGLNNMVSEHRSRRARTDVAVTIAQSKGSAAGVITKHTLKFLVRRRIILAAGRIRAELAQAKIDAVRTAENARRIAEEEKAAAEAESVEAMHRVQLDVAEMEARAEEAQRLLDFRHAADTELLRCRAEEEAAIGEAAEAAILERLETARAEAEEKALAAAEAERKELLDQIKTFTGEVEFTEAARQMEADRREDLEERLAEVEEAAQETQRRMAEEHECVSRNQHMFDRAAVKKERQARVQAEETVRKESQMRAQMVKKERAARVAAEANVRKEAEARSVAEQRLKEMEVTLAGERERAAEAEAAAMEAAVALEATAAVERLATETKAREVAEAEAMAEVQRAQAKEEETKRLRAQEEAAAAVAVAEAEHAAALVLAAQQAADAVRAAEADAAKAEVERVAADLVAHEQMLHKAAITISKWFCNACLPLVRVRKMLNGFRRLQGVWQSKAQRTAAPPKLQQMRQRLAVADANARSKPTLTLGKQTKEALHTLQCGKMISHLLKACATLELSTDLSKRCCTDFASASASGILFGLIRSCNRSKPHQELLRHALVIVLNVARHNDLAPQVAAAEHSADVLIDLMQMFRDKKAIFGLASELLCRLIVACPATKQQMHQADCRKRLDSILTLVERKHRLEEKVRSARGAKKESNTPIKGCKNYLCTQEPIFCIRHLMTLLQ
jgi:hypothetical protein